MTDRSSIAKELARFGLDPKRGLGQNFLVDETTLEQIAELADIRPDETVVEIGPGTGALTRRLAARAKRVVAIERDRELACLLEGVASDCPNVSIRIEDARRTDLAAFERPVRVVANLPYYITSDMLVKGLVECFDAGGFTYLVQKEAAARFAARPGSRDYGPVHVLIGLYGSLDRPLHVAADKFWPRPEIESTLIRLRPHDRPLFDGDAKALFALLRTSFAARRKTLLNNLGASGRPKTLVREQLVSLGLAEDVRAEDVAPAQFLALSRALADQT